MKTVTARMGFASPTTVSRDPQRGLLRVANSDKDIYTSSAAELLEDLDMREVPLTDWGSMKNPDLNLWEKGFDCIDLTRINGLVEELQEVARTRYLSDKNIRTLRRKLLGRSFKLSNGKKLRLLFIAGDGFILRMGGPNAINITTEKLSAHNGHYSAPVIHGDQDVFGTPVKQILKGLAPKLFRHKTPDSMNSKSPVFLVNLWLPLQQINQPLALLDRSTLDQKQHQLLHATAVEAFLDREGDTSMNDIWMFLYDKSQQWYFNSELNAGKAYVFDTLGEAHGGITISGEEVAEQYYHRLYKQCEALDNNDEAAIKNTASLKASLYPDDITDPLRLACDTMFAVIQEAQIMSIDKLKMAGWKDKAEAAMDKVVRKSIEMRAVAWVS